MNSEIILVGMYIALFKDHLQNYVSCSLTENWVHVEKYESDLEMELSSIYTLVLKFGVYHYIVVRHAPSFASFPLAWE